MAEIKEKSKFGNTIFYIDNNEIKKKVNLEKPFSILMVTK